MLIFSDRKNLETEFRKWAEENNVDVSPFSAITWLACIKGYQPMQWISVKDRMPEEPGEVLMVLYGRVCIAWYHCDGRFESGSGLVFSAGKAVTHWMPLPEPPKED